MISAHISAKYRNSLIPMFWSRHFWADLAKYVVFLGVAIFFLWKMLGQNSQKMEIWVFAKTSIFDENTYFNANMCFLRKYKQNTTYAKCIKSANFEKFANPANSTHFQWNAMNNWRKTCPGTGFLHISLVTLVNAFILFLGPPILTQFSQNTALFSGLGVPAAD